jgi:hypothetical protein
MKNATVVCALATLLLGATACRGQPGENPRCRIFDQGVPSQPDAGTLAPLEEAYHDLDLIGECAKAAAVSVDEFMRRRDIRAKLDEVLTQLQGALTTTAETVVDQARGTVQQVQEGASRAMQQSVDRIEEGIKAATGQ